MPPNSRTSLPSAIGVSTPVGVYTAASPAPAARKRSTSVPWGTSSYVISPLAIWSSAADFTPARAVNDMISSLTWCCSISGRAPGGIVLPTRQSRRLPRAHRAASRLTAWPALWPNPETAIRAPSGRSAIASAGEAKTLSISPGPGGARRCP